MKYLTIDNISRFRCIVQSGKVQVDVLEFRAAELKLDLESIMSSPRIDLEKEWISIRMD